MKAMIAISRNVQDYKFFNDIFEEKRYGYDINIIEILVSDINNKMVQYYAESNNISLNIYQTEWDKYGRSAYLIRNKFMTEAADILIAIWDNQFDDVKFAIDYMHILKKPVFVFTPIVHARKHNRYKSSIDYTIV